VKQTCSGLWVANKGFNFLRMRKQERTITLPNGERAKVTIDDSGTVRHVEHGDHLDALVRPAPIRGSFRLVNAATVKGGFARPSPIRTSATPKGPQ
jgi:hypothetical protein